MMAMDRGYHTARNDGKMRNGMLPIVGALVLDTLMTKEV